MLVTDKVTLHLGVPSHMTALSAKGGGGGGEDTEVTLKRTQMSAGLFFAHVVLLVDHGLLWVDRYRVIHACLHHPLNKSSNIWAWQLV